MGSREIVRPVIRLRRIPSKQYIFILSGVARSEFFGVFVEVIRTNAADIALFPIVKPIWVARCSPGMIRRVLRKKNFNAGSLDRISINKQLDRCFSEIIVLRRY